MSDVLESLSVNDHICHGVDWMFMNTEVSGCQGICRISNTATSRREPLNNNIGKVIHTDNGRHVVEPNWPGTVQDVLVCPLRKKDYEI